MVTGVFPRSSSSQLLTSASFSTNRRGRERFYVSCKFVRSSAGQSSLYTTNRKKIFRSRSCDKPRTRTQTMKRSCSASFANFSDDFDDEEFSKKLLESTIQSNQRSDSIQYSRDSRENMKMPTNQEESRMWTSKKLFSSKFHLETLTPPLLGIPTDPPDWVDKHIIIPACVERRANSVDLPLSLRMIKKKKQWQEGFREAGETALCSVKKAFSSMVFIIRELHCFSLQLKEALSYDDLQEILVTVQNEIHSSFVWLFQQVFSHTPVFMVYIMILLANFTVYSMNPNLDISPLPPYTTESVVAVDDSTQPKSETPSIRTFPLSVYSYGGKTASIGGNGGDGGKFKPVAGGTGGGDESSVFPRISSLDNSITNKEEKSVSLSASEERLWKSMMEEAITMNGTLSEFALEQETMRLFVAPITVKVEPDDYISYFKTELMYQQALSQDPNNSLVLCNYAEFLHLIVHDNDRAEEYFKRASQIQPPDAESLSRYADFLWLIRKDIASAEEKYLEAIDAEPSNHYYAGKYAQFLWNSGGEDTCFPLDSDSYEV